MSAPGVAQPVPSLAVPEPINLSDNRPRSKPAFALTPLADVMFQLLIFFMLSSSLSPYALVPLVPPSDPRAAEAVLEGQPPEDIQQSPVAIWQVGRGEIRANGARLNPDQLAPALEELMASGTEEVLLLTSASATTQDIATALEAIRVSGLPRVRLIGRGEG